MTAANSEALERLSAQTRGLPAGLALEADARGVRVALESPNLSFYHSFVTGALARRASQAGQALTRACGNRQRSIVTVLDLTAGWGADSLTLACHGRQTLLIEQNTLLCAILQYSLACLRESGATGVQTAGRIGLICADACDYLLQPDIETAFDCIYLDPMFPPRKSGARPSADMQILQQITGNTESESCLELALANGRNRVVVKRPAKAARISADKPDLVYREKSVRFDIYLTA